MGKQIVIQSFYPYPHRVELRDEDGKARIGGDGLPVVVTIPPLKKSPKNILITTEEVYADLQRDKSFLNFVAQGNKGGFVILKDVPSSYWDAQQQVAQIRAEIDSKEEALRTSNALNEELQNKIKALEDQVKSFGGEVL
jgi:hypothetical protein